MEIATFWGLLQLYALRVFLFVWFTVLWTLLSSSVAQIEIHADGHHTALRIRYLVDQGIPK